MARIYLSSTYEDLKEHRRVVYDALRKSGHDVIAMEDYVATEQRPVDNCLKDIEAADIYIGIFAFRYGYVPPSSQSPGGLSVTEIELRHAESLQKPCLIFLLNESTKWPPQFVDAASSSDKGERIKKLREYLSTHKAVSYFSLPDELALTVPDAVMIVTAGGPQRPQIVSEGVGSSSAPSRTQAVGEAVTGSQSVDPAEPAANQTSSPGRDKANTSEHRTFDWRSLIGRAARIAPFGIVLGLGLFASITLTRNGLSSLDASFTSQPVSKACGSVPGFGPEMVLISGGTYQMGDFKDEGSPFEKPAHNVSVQSFAIAICEVTFEEYDRFAIATGRQLPDDQGWGRGRRPVINVSWEDGLEYAKWLSGQTGKRYRLPTEAEWEYAARSGGKDELRAGTSKEEELSEFAWYATNSSNKTQLVGGEKTNGVGLYDMSGNVWEWVEDCWHVNYSAAPTDGRAWRQENGGDCSQRVIRGGSWSTKPDNLRSSNRYRYTADDRDNNIGFRLAQDLN